MCVSLWHFSSMVYMVVYYDNMLIWGYLKIIQHYVYHTLAHSIYLYPSSLITFLYPVLYLLPFYVVSIFPHILWIKYKFICDDERTEANAIHLYNHQPKPFHIYKEERSINMHTNTMVYLFYTLDTYVYSLYTHGRWSEWAIYMLCSCMLFMAYGKI